MQHLLVHGCLHLLGFDHEKTNEAEKMERIEIKILQKLNIDDPYDLSARENINLWKQYRDFVALRYFKSANYLMDLKHWGFLKK